MFRSIFEFCAEEFALCPLSLRLSGLEVGILGAAGIKEYSCERPPCNSQSAWQSRASGPKYVVRSLAQLMNQSH